MKNFFTRLKGRKGFTLVECMIALAVFAALTLVVFAILTNARTASVKANESEENLTKLIDNVVEDESFVKYNPANTEDLLTLKLSTGGTDFRVTYAEIDGYQNYVLCPAANCQHFAENTEFMGNKTMEEFDQSAYVCPKCGATIVQKLLCEDCGNKGEHPLIVPGSTTAGRFTYIPSNGGYFCNDCGGTAVRGENIDESTISNYDLNVKTLVPNAIVYGNVTRPADEAASEALFRLYKDGHSGATSSVEMKLSYAESSNVTIPGTYTLEVMSPWDEQDFVIDVTLPGGYRIVDLRAKNGDCLGMTKSDGTPYLHFTGCDRSAVSKIEFQLVNEQSGLSFEEDYKNESNPSASGLSGYWFYMTSNLKNVTNPMS